MGLVVAGVRVPPRISDLVPGPRSPRLSTLERGDRVRLTRPAGSVTRPDRLPVGTVGVLGELYRIQDGAELWSFWAGEPACVYAVAHTGVERTGAKQEG